MPKSSSYFVKMCVLVALVLAMTSLAQGAIIAYGYFQGIDVTDGKSILKLLGSADHSLASRMLIGLNHLFAFVLASILWVWYYYGQDIKEYFRWKQIDYKYLLLFILALLTSYPLMAYLSVLIEKLPLPTWAKGMNDTSMEALAGLLSMENFSDLVFNILIVGILPGLGEELLFRGVIQNEIIKKWAKPHTAIWLTAFLFAAVHLQVSGFPAKFIIGALLGYAYYLSGSLKLPVILHAANNSMATIALYVSGDKLDVASAGNTQQDLPLASVIGASILSAYVWLLIFKHRQKSNSMV
jgi:hypothetical protein